MKKLNGKLQWLPAWNSLEISANVEASEVVKTSSPQLHEFGINEKMNEPEGVLLFQSKIIFLAKFFGGDWDPSMAKETAKIAYREANWMTVAEVKLFIARFECGKYTSHKNFTPAIFMEHLNGYINEILSTRGAVNSYAWRDHVVADELFQPTPNPATGEVKFVDPEVLKKMLNTMSQHFRDLEQLQRKEDERIRKAKWQGIKDQRDQQIVDLIERDAAQGIAPDKYMIKKYFEALHRLTGK